MFANLLNLFFPEVCAGCDSVLLNGETVICTSCRHGLPLTNHLLTPENEAFQKFYGKIPVEFVATLCYFHKKGMVQEMIHKLKYKGQENIGAAMGTWLANDLKSLDIIREVDAIIPVPIHRRRLRERGYNQVHAFGEALSDTLGIPLVEDLLVRKVYSKSQTKKNRAGRSSNSQTVFDIDLRVPTAHKHFLLIDDVLTTGATLEACGRALLQIENARISIVCIAMTK